MNKLNKDALAFVHNERKILLAGGYYNHYGLWIPCLVRTRDEKVECDEFSNSELNKSSVTN